MEPEDKYFRENRDRAFAQVKEIIKSVIKRMLFTGLISLLIGRPLRPVSRSTYRTGKIILAVIFILFVLHGVFIKSPAQFPVGELILIPQGATLNEVADLLEEENIIKSPLLFKGFVVLRAGQRGIVGGDYFFNKRHSVLGVSRRMTKGEYGLIPKKVTLPEGASVSEMAIILEKNFPEFNPKEFVLLAKKSEGFLFPDTYFFLPNVKAPQVYRDLRDIFEIRIKEVEEEIANGGRTLREIIIMASLLEEEARTTETRRIISGILWDRIEIGMPLQVDAVFPYFTNKNTFTLTLEDLKIDSPYNTYKYRGLPIGPITNPGMDSILAALNPTKSPYLFYLSDMDGEMHYARTFEGHLINKSRYLR